MDHQDAASFANGFTQRPLFLYDIVWLMILSLFVWFAAVGIGWWILQDFPNSADEHAYRFQSQIFAEGQICAPAHPMQEYLNPFYIIMREEKVFSLFPPGWPAILSIGQRIGRPDLINPLLGAVCVPVIFFCAWALYGRESAWISVLFLVFSPFFLFNSASYFSHSSCLLMVTLALLFMILWLKRERTIFAVIMGVSFSLAFAIRELTAVAALTPLFLFTMVYSRKRVRFLSTFLIGMAPIALIYLWYNAELSGRWFVPLRFLEPSESMGFGTREIRLFDYVEMQEFGPLDALVYLGRNLGRLLLWTVPGLPLLAIAGVWWGRCDRWMRLFAISAVLLLVAYFFYPTEGGNQYGPRFYYESMVFLTILAARGLLFIWHRSKVREWRRMFYYAVVLIVLLDLFSIVYYGNYYQRQIYERRSIYRLVESRKLKNAIVFVGSPSGDMTQGDLIRNPPDLSKADVIYAWDMGRRNIDILKAFPSRIGYFFGENALGGYYLERILSEP